MNGKKIQRSRTEMRENENTLCVRDRKLESVEINEKLKLPLSSFSYPRMSRGGCKCGLEEEKCRKRVTAPAVIKMTDVCSRWRVFYDLYRHSI